MNVFIEVNPLHQAERTGVANYLHFWLRAMLAQAPGDQFTLWSPELTQKKRWQAYAQLLAPRLAHFGHDFSLRSERPIVQRLDAAFGDLRLENLRLPLRVLLTLPD